MRCSPIVPHKRCSTIVFRAFMNIRLLMPSLPRAIVDGVFVSCAGHGHIPLNCPLIRVFEALARVRLRWSMQEAPCVELMWFEQPSGFFDEVMNVRSGVLLDFRHRARLCPKHRRKGFSVE